MGVAGWWRVRTGSDVRLRLLLLVVENLDVGAVEDSVGEIADPVANDEEALTTGTDDGVDDLVAVTEDEEIGGIAIGCLLAGVEDLPLTVEVEGLPCASAVVGIVGGSACAAPCGGDDSGEVWV